MFGSASLIYAWDHGLLPFTESTSELDEPDNVEQEDVKSDIDELQSKIRKPVN